MRQLLEQIVPQHWDNAEPAAGSGFPRVRFLQDISDLVARPINNRLNVLAPNNTQVQHTGAILSLGLGTGAQQPKRYAEFTVKARVSFNLSANGAGYMYVYRTTGAIPAQGQPPNAGDVIVGGDAFAGGQLTANVNHIGTLSLPDTGLDVTKTYKYYLAAVAPAGTAMKVVNNSQLWVMERS